MVHITIYIVCIDFVELLFMILYQIKICLRALTNWNFHECMNMGNYIKKRKHNFMNIINILNVRLKLQSQNIINYHIFSHFITLLNLSDIKYMCIN